MEDNEGEILTRLARIEERQKILHDEQLRSRRRLHKVEGAVDGLVMLQREKIRAERQRDKRSDRRFRFLTICVAVAGILLPSIQLIRTVWP